MSEISNDNTDIDRDEWLADHNTSIGVWGTAIDAYVDRIEHGDFDGDDMAGGVSRACLQVLESLFEDAVQEGSPLSQAVTDACHASYALALRHVAMSLQLDLRDLEYFLSVNCDTSWKLSCETLPTSKELESCIERQ